MREKGEREKRKERKKKEKRERNEEKREEREDHSRVLFSLTRIAISSPVELIEANAHNPFHEEFPGYP